MEILVFDIETGKSPDHMDYLPDKYKEKMPEEIKNPVEPVFKADGRILNSKDPADNVMPLKISKDKVTAKAWLEEQSKKIEERKTKIQCSIAENKMKWIEATTEARKKWAKDKEEKINKWIEDCALDALTGQVLAIGYRYVNYKQVGVAELHDIEMTGQGKFNDEVWTEASVIADFWARFNNTLKKGGMVIGHGTSYFDLPFLWRRSKKYNVTPYWHPTGKDKWNTDIRDTDDMWNCNQYPKKRIKLDTLAKYLGIGEKLDNGKNFEHMFHNDLPKALAYLQQDINLISQIAIRLI
jgi:hypothetical protein